MYRAQTLHLVGLYLFLLTLTGCEQRTHLVEQHLLEFGTIIEISLITDDLNRAEHLLVEIERRLQHYREQWHAWEDSELTRFNAALQRGQIATIPPSLRELLALSKRYHDASRGLFNPALGKLIAAWGFHADEPDLEEIERVKRRMPSMDDLIFGEDHASSLNPELQLDFGGIAKGYAVGQIAAFLDANDVEHYLVNAGGDLQSAGNRFGRPWRIGVQNPFAPGVVASIHLQGKHSLFTSGNYRRRYWRGGGLSHHIIDPRSGEPSTGQSSATVLASDPVLADVAATVLMIDGARKPLDLALSLGIEDLLIVSDQRELILTRSFAGKIEIHVPWPSKIIN